MFNAVDAFCQIILHKGCTICWEILSEMSWNQPPEEDRPRDQRKSLITQEIMKGTYRQKQNLGRQHGSGSPHQKGDEGLIYAAPRNTGDL